MARTKVRFYNSNIPREPVVPAVLHESYCRSSPFQEVWQLPVGSQYEPPERDGWWEQFPSEEEARDAAIQQANRRGVPPSSITWETNCCP